MKPMYSKKLRIACLLLTLLPVPLAPVLGLGDFGLGLIEPVSMALVLWLCMKATEGEEKNKKVNRLVLWLMPVLSNGCFFLSYALNRGLRFSVMRVTVGFFGLMMVVLGNYMPKCRQNYFVGIRLAWTLNSENNWNATHRMAGPVWVLLGGVTLLSLPFSEKICMAVMLGALALMLLIPTVYSFWYDRRERKLGIPRKGLPVSRKRNRLLWITLAAVLALTAVLLFTGSVHTELGESALQVKATYDSGVSVPYGEIRGCTYREEDDPGIRVFGLGSFRLLCGRFQNGEFGDYTRCTRYRPQGIVVLDTDTGTVVLSGNTKAETEELYRAILEKIG